MANREHTGIEGVPVDTSNKKMREYWNGEGGTRWLRFQKRIDDSLKQYTTAVINSANTITNFNILDIGCGCGDTTFELSREVGSKGHVHGIDISAPILEHAQKRSTQEGVDNIQFSCVDAQNHAFKNANYDLMFSRFGVMFFDNPIKAFTNIRNALAQKGQVSFICWQSVDNNQWIKHPLEITRQHIPIPPPPAPDEPGPFSLADKTRIREILDCAGFSNITITPFYSPLKVGTTLEEAIDFLTSMGPTRISLEQAEVSEAARKSLLGELAKSLTPFYSDQGYHLDTATWIVNATHE